MTASRVSRAGAPRPGSTRSPMQSPPFLGPASRSPKAAPVDRCEDGQTRPRGAALAPSPAAPQPRSSPSSRPRRAHLSRARRRDGEGARKEESAPSAALPPLGSSEVGTTPAAARCSGAGRARARASVPPEPGWQRGKGVSRGGGLASAPPFPGPHPAARGPLPRPIAPGQHPAHSRRPPPPPASAALGVARLAAPAGGDRWRRVTMATRGVRRGPSLPPPPGVTHLGASPGRRRRRRERRGGRRPGPEAAGSGWGGNARAAVSARRRSSLRRASEHQSVSPSFLPRPLPARRPPAQPPADCGCQTGPSPSRRRQPIAALPRGASGPRRAGRPGRCLRGKETRGRTLGAWRGEDPPGPAGSGPALRGLAGPRGRAGVAMAEDPQPRRRPRAASDRGSRNSAPGVVVPQWGPLRIRMDS